jgi:hypothetical protein
VTILQAKRGLPYSYLMVAPNYAGAQRALALGAFSGTAPEIRNGEFIKKPQSRDFDWRNTPAFTKTLLVCTRSSAG